MSKNLNTIDICPLPRANTSGYSVSAYLVDLLDVSKSMLKKSALSKSFLSKEVKDLRSLKVPIDLVNYLMINPNYSGEAARKVAQTDDFLVLSKPHQVHSHPLCYSDKNTLLNWLQTTEDKDYLDVNPKKYDRGLIYRLDYETSGLILYAKNEDVYKKYRLSFQNEFKEKIYLAVCHNKLSRESSFKDKISYRDRNRSRAYISCGGEFLGFIRVEPIAYNEKENLSLVKVFLKEGHRHQIRVQLSYHGHPILGDTLYQGKHSKRLYLHCYKYKLQNEFFSDSELSFLRPFFDFNGEL